MDIKKFVKYFKKSKAFCVMPWINLTVQTDGFTAPCCFAIHEKFLRAEELDFKTPLEFLNNDKLVNLRKEMVSGILPETCKKCRYADKINSKTSPREHYNNAAINFLDSLELSNLLDSINEDGTIQSESILYSIDSRDGNLCNLMCRICSPQFSSRIQAEEKVSFIQKSNFSLLSHPRLLTNLKAIYFSGGEPLLSAYHYDLLEKLRPDCKITYNTNFTILKTKRGNILDKWKNFPSLDVLVSLDDFNERLSYARHGSNFSEIVENFQLFHEQIEDSYKKISVSISISVFNIIYIDAIISRFLELNLVKPDRIYINRVEHHPFSIEIFYHSIKGLAHAAVSKIENENIRTTILDYFRLLDDIPPNMNEMIASLEAIKAKDQIRNENFQETFPELHQQITRFLQTPD